jgi:hypothetical protein
MLNDVRMISQWNREGQQVLKFGAKTFEGSVDVILRKASA